MDLLLTPGLGRLVQMTKWKPWLWRIRVYWKPQLPKWVEMGLGSIVYYLIRGLLTPITTVRPLWSLGHWWTSELGRSTWDNTINPSDGSGFNGLQSEFVGWLLAGVSACKMSKTQLKVFDLISNGKCVNGVPYSDPTQYLSALCSFSRDMGVIYYPTKCKGIFSFDFGQSVFIEEFGYLGWMEIRHS